MFTCRIIILSSSSGSSSNSSSSNTLREFMFCYTNGVSSGRSPGRHQASWELCGKEARMNKALRCGGIFASRFTVENPSKSMPDREWVPIRSQVRAGDFQGFEGHPRAPQSTPKGTPRRPKSTLGDPQGHPKSDQGFAKSAQREPKSDSEGPWDWQNRAKVAHRREKK